MALDELLDEHEQGEKVRTWLKENALGLVGGLVLGLALIGGGKWWTQRQHEARVALGEAYDQVVRAIEEFELDEDLHREVSDLSYGKRRLLAIARAVAMHPSVLLLDEPAAGLSSVESVELARVVRRLADEWGMAILVVEHDMNFVMGVCDQVVVLDFGAKIAEGTPDQVRNNPGVIAAYLGDKSDDELDIRDSGIRTPATIGGE